MENPGRRGKCQRKQIATPGEELPEALRGSGSLLQKQGRRDALRRQLPPRWPAREEFQPTPIK